jgi:hypothetical protein
LSGLLLLHLKLFHTAPKPLGTWQVNELSVAGTPVLPTAGSGPILGYSKDSWATLTYSWVNVPSTRLGWFDLNSVSGAVTVGSAANLDFLVTPFVNLTVMVTYVQLALTDIANVTVSISEVNKPALWDGLYNVSTGASMPAISILESTPASAAVGRVAFTDPNTRWPWNVRNYAIVPVTYGSEFFAIDPVSGIVTVTAARALMSWYVCFVACLIDSLDFCATV